MKTKDELHSVRGQPSILRLFMAVFRCDNLLQNTHARLSGTTLLYLWLRLKVSSNSGGD